MLHDGGRRIKAERSLRAVRGANNEENAKSLHCNPSNSCHREKIFLDLETQRIKIAARPV